MSIRPETAMRIEAETTRNSLIEHLYAAVFGRQRNLDFESRVSHCRVFQEKIEAAFSELVGSATSSKP